MPCKFEINFLHQVLTYRSHYYRRAPWYFNHGLSLHHRTRICPHLRSRCLYFWSHFPHPRQRFLFLCYCPLYFLFTLLFAARAFDALFFLNHRFGTMWPIAKAGNMHCKWHLEVLFKNQGVNILKVIHHSFEEVTLSLVAKGLVQSWGPGEFKTNDLECWAFHDTSDSIRGNLYYFKDRPNKQNRRVFLPIP